MSALTSNYYQIVSELPADALVIFHNATWEDYEDLLEQVGEATYLRISFDDGNLRVMTISAEHERYARFLERLITVIILGRRINILSFGSATMRKQKKRKGVEPDACFYVQSAELIGNRIQLDFATDPPPDIALEVEIHQDSLSKLPIYAALGIGEVWRFDGETLTIHLLERDGYCESVTSRGLPMLTAQILTDAIARLRRDGELQALIAFEEWLKTLPS